MWERACPRKRWVSQHHCLLGHRLRGQARSHRGDLRLSSQVPCDHGTNSTFNPRLALRP